MTIRELIEALEDVAAEHGDETEVKMAHQPSYPLAAPLRAVTALPANEDEPEDLVPYVLWLAAGESTSYAPAAAWDGDR